MRWLVAAAGFATLVFCPQLTPSRDDIVTFPPLVADTAMNVLFPKVMSLHVGVTLVGEREWTIRLSVNVKRKHKD